MDDDRIDFSALDPKRDAARFRRMVDTIVAGARSPVSAALFLVHELVFWGRAAVAISALLALTAWLPTLVRNGSNWGQGSVSSVNDPVELVSSWARFGKVPTEIDPIEELGELDGR
jgi:hypothetical protein